MPRWCSTRPKATVFRSKYFHGRNPLSDYLKEDIPFVFEKLMLSGLRRERLDKAPVGSKIRRHRWETDRRRTDAPFSLDAS
jgi:hypothetical protein